MYTKGKKNRKKTESKKESDSHQTLLYPALIACIYPGGKPPACAAEVVSLQWKPFSPQQLLTIPFRGNDCKNVLQKSQCFILPA